MIQNFIFDDKEVKTRYPENEELRAAYNAFHWASDLRSLSAAQIVLPELVRHLQSIPEKSRSLISSRLAFVALRSSPDDPSWAVLLLKHGLLHPGWREEWEGDNVFATVAYGKIKMWNFLHSKGFDPHIPNDKGDTIISSVLLDKPLMPFVDWLLQRGACINDKNHMGTNALGLHLWKIAFSAEGNEWLSFFAARGLNFLQNDAQGRNLCWSPLVFLKQKKENRDLLLQDWGAVDQLIGSLRRMGVAESQRDSLGYTPLISSVELVEPEMTRILMKNGASLKEKTASGESVHDIFDRVRQSLDKNISDGRWAAMRSILMGDRLLHSCSSPLLIHSLSRV